MLRFYRKDLNENYIVRHIKNELIMDPDIWKNCLTFLKERELYNGYLIDIIPVKNEAGGELIAYGYQDDEANRELRMLKELRNSRNILQFTDVYPEYKEVIIIGCNELAVSFAHYLQDLGILVSVIGEYWNYFGFESSYETDLSGEGKLVVYAEGIIFQNGDLISAVKRSVSPEFECIDKVYEENVRKGMIHDTIGNFEQLICKLRETKQEIVILGDDSRAQDAYDLLLSNGIDICCFAVNNKKSNRILGKKVLDISDAIKILYDPVFINCKDNHGALGEEWTEFFDYMGYKRNRQYYLLMDYTDIPVSNLVHVMHGKKVLCTGDRRLCKLLSDYLYDIEKGEVSVEYIDLTEKLTIKDDDIPCLVVADYKNRLNNVGKKRYNLLQKSLADVNFINYTEYYISNHSFALIDLYLNQNSPKYSMPELMPKGILLGRIPCWSGNVFFRGVMDGHSEILEMPYSDLNENLFYYCIRLAHIDSSELLNEFWRMYNDEAQSKEVFFKNPVQFESCIKRFSELKSSFTSQELFVLFQIAYVEMINSHNITDIDKRIIYWEPHFVSRNEFPFYALWLEDEKIKGQTIVLRRNNIVRTGSGCKRKVDGWNSWHPFYTMFYSEYECDEDDMQYHYWTEYKMRFEDIKVRPQENLTEVCNKLGISWSDSMLKTTVAGNRPLSYRGSVDFDLKAVFNAYEDFLSEFDRFRVTLASGPYQKRYGYASENCYKFSRREIQEWFLKPFRFDEISLFGDQSDNIKLYKWVMWQMWKVRKQFVHNEIFTEFEQFELGRKEEPLKNLKYDEKHDKNEISSISQLMKYMNKVHKFVLYGTGYACRAITKFMDEKIASRVVYCDKKAELQSYSFQGSKVIPPYELCDKYKDYSILVTSSKFADNIRYEFMEMGIKSSRVFYNKLEL